MGGVVVGVGREGWWWMSDQTDINHIKSLWSDVGLRGSVRITKRLKRNVSICWLLLAAVFSCVRRSGWKG